LKSNVLVPLLLVLLLPFGLFSASWADIRDDGSTSDDADDLIDIYVTGESEGGIPIVKKTPIAVQLFVNAGGTADTLGLVRKLADEVAADMEFTGSFEVVDRARYVENPHATGDKPGQFDFNDWAIIDVQYVIKGNFQLADDKLTVQFRLYNVPERQMMLGKEYSGKPEDWYYMVHRFSNDVVYALTGNQGVFGTKIAFTSDKTGDYELYVVDVDGRNLKRLTFLGGRVRNPTWSPDGSQLVFAWENTHNELDPHHYLYSVPAAGGEPQLLLKVEGVLITPRFSPSGSRIAMSITYHGNSEIYTVSAKGGKPQRLTVSNAIEVFPAWSPKGDWIAFVSNKPGGPQIFKMRNDGTEMQRISFFGAYNQSPDWAFNISEGRERIVFSARESGMYRILMINPDGSDAIVITQGHGFVNCEYPSFSPDGRAIVMTTNSGTGRIVRIFNVDGSYTKQLTKLGTDDTNPAWSPRLLN